MNSALYIGLVRHRRREAPARAFTYRLFMTWLDLAELPEALDRSEEHTSELQSL